MTAQRTNIAHTARARKTSAGRRTTGARSQPARVDPPRALKGRATSAQANGLGFASVVSRIVLDNDGLCPTPSPGSLRSPPSPPKGARAIVKS